MLGHYFRLGLIGYYFTPIDIDNFIISKEPNSNTPITVVKSHMFGGVVIIIVEDVKCMGCLANCKWDFIEHMDLVNCIWGEDFIKHMDLEVGYFIDMVIELKVGYKWSKAIVVIHNCN